MLYFTVISILFFLAAQVFAVSLGIDVRQTKAKSFLFAGSLAIGQALFFWLGYSLGGWFMHWMEGFKSIVIFAVLFIISIRMLMESFQVWKGERIYILDNLRLVQIAGLAQGINTFLVGLLFVFIPFQRDWLTMVLFAFTVLFSLTGTLVKSTKNSLTFAALMFVLGGLVMAFSSIYVGFFAL